MPTPALQALAQALKPTWQESQLAGRVQRQVNILRHLAHALSTAADRQDRPKDAAEAETQLWDVLTKLQRETPRRGMSAKTAQFLDQVVATTGRYGPHLFPCFDDPRLPATTNEEEGFFGVNKRAMRKALGCGSTTNSPVANLGADWMLALHQVRRGGHQQILACIDLPAYQQARAELAQQEQPATKRRSCLRNLGGHLTGLLARWMASD